MTAQGQTAIDWITLGIALVGLGLAVLSLVVQYRSHRSEREEFTKSGAVVEVSLNGVVIGTEPLTEGIAITARNVGRLGVDVTSWGVILPDSYQVLWLKPLPGNPDLKHRLEPGSRASWWLPLSGVRDALRERGLAESDVSMYVDLATGEHLVTSETMKLGPSPGP